MTRLARRNWTRRIKLIKKMLGSKYKRRPKGWKIPGFDPSQPISYTYTNRRYRSFADKPRR